MEGTVEQESGEELFGSYCTIYEKMLSPQNEELIAIKRLSDKEVSIQFIRADSSKRLTSVWQTSDNFGLAIVHSLKGRTTQIIRHHKPPDEHFVLMQVMGFGAARQKKKFAQAYADLDWVMKRPTL